MERTVFSGAVKDEGTSFSVCCTELQNIKAATKRVNNYCYELEIRSKN